MLYLLVKTTQMNVLKTMCSLMDFKIEYIYCHYISICHRQRRAGSTLLY